MCTSLMVLSGKIGKIEYTSKIVQKSRNFGQYIVILTSLSVYNGIMDNQYIQTTNLWDLHPESKFKILIKPGF